jgi:hypothetical protein
MKSVVRAISLLGRFGKAKLKDGRTSDSRIIQGDRIVGGNDSVDGVDEIGGDGGHQGGIERCNSMGMPLKKAE